MTALTILEFDLLIWSSSLATVSSEKMFGILLKETETSPSLYTADAVHRTIEILSSRHELYREEKIHMEMAQLHISAQLFLKLNKIINNKAKSSTIAEF